MLEAYTKRPLLTELKDMKQIIFHQLDMQADLQRKYEDMKSSLQTFATRALTEATTLEVFP